MQGKPIHHESVLHGVILLELNVGRHFVLVDCESLDVPRVLEYLRQRVLVNLPVKISYINAVLLVFGKAGLE